MNRHRSWLFVPADRPDFFEKAFSRGADVVVLDLEDGVSAAAKSDARALAVQVAGQHEVWVRVNRPGTDEGEADMAALAGTVAGFRVPKVDSAADAAWVVARAKGAPVACTIESALGLLSSFEIARTQGVTGLVFGAEDYRRDVGCSGDAEALRHARSQIVATARAAALERPVDGAYIGLSDAEGLTASCIEARRLGFGGKSVVHPAQIEIVNRVFDVTDDEREWATSVTEAFAASRGRPTSVAGDLVDRPVAERARLLLEKRDVSA